MRIWSWRMWQTYLAVMGGGAVGVGARMFLSGWITGRYGHDFPWGTMVVNIAGCFLIGLLAGFSGPGSAVPPILRQVLAIGVLGGFTTYSSFSLQTISLVANGQVLFAVANAVATLVFCLLGTWAGLALGGGVLAVSHVSP